MNHRKLLSYLISDLKRFLWFFSAVPQLQGQISLLPIAFLKSESGAGEAIMLTGDESYACASQTRWRWGKSIHRWRCLARFWHDGCAHAAGAACCAGGWERGGAGRVLLPARGSLPVQGMGLGVTRRWALVAGQIRGNRRWEGATAMREGAAPSSRTASPQGVKCKRSLEKW